MSLEARMYSRQFDLQALSRTIFESKFSLGMFNMRAVTKDYSKLGPGNLFGVLSLLQTLANDSLLVSA